ncbi:Ankyrin repeat and KH domain-containing protein mask [Colletotrichum spinosum]|uniref:Ankyrin repeat and KH domain-containing protein mask n=1 Tax=Colletotrichum spinosum TaxID=1347390 RepID=A0A4V6QEE3_9PEZI|nr:Ankyrin repeat and KH domain-containing protein mask [Colletotrichum spinosum]
MHEWEDHGAKEFCRSYLTYRVKRATERDRGFHRIKQVVDDLLEELRADRDVVIGQVCIMVFTRTCSWHASNDKVLVNLASYFGCKRLLQSLLDDGSRDDCFAGCLAEPRALALMAGHFDVVKLLDRHPERKKCHYFWRWDGLYDVAAKSTDAAVARRILEYYTKNPFVRPFYRGQLSNSWEVNQMIRTDQKKWRGIPPRVKICGNTSDKSALERFCWLGSLDMARHLLDDDAGVALGDESRALGAAARAGHEEVVDLLLRRGADPNGEGLMRGVPMLAAVSGGSLAIVKKLAEHGAVLSTHADEAVKLAISLEHTAMVEYLLESSGLLRFDKFSKFYFHAQAKGLESW